MRSHFHLVHRLATVCLLAGASACLIAADGGQAGGKNESHVKLSATAGKIEANGRQVVTIKMDVDKGWHAYANPVKNEAFEPNRTEVKISGARKLTAVTIEYPNGQRLVD